MEFRKIIALSLGLICTSSVFAGKEDWNGSYKVQVSDTVTWDVVHTPTQVKILFISSGVCTHLGKGASINGVKIKEDLDLCVAENVPNFTKEVQKLGTIVNKSVKLGPTYSE